MLVTQYRPVVRRREALSCATKIQQQYGKPGIRVLPGRGAETDANLLYAQLGYLREFIAIVDSNKNDDGARAAMIERFPGYGGRDFQLAMTLQNRKALPRSA